MDEFVLLLKLSIMVFVERIQLCRKNFCLDVQFYPDVFRELHEAIASWVVIILAFLNHGYKLEIKHFTWFNISHDIKGYLLGSFKCH